MEVVQGWAGRMHLLQPNSQVQYSRPPLQLRPVRGQVSTHSDAVRVHHHACVPITPPNHPVYPVRQAGTSSARRPYSPFLSMPQRGVDAQTGGERPNSESRALSGGAGRLCAMVQVGRRAIWAPGRLPDVPARYAGVCGLLL